MILLMQVQGDVEDRWEDMRIPTNPSRPPIRGVPTACTTADEVAALLVKAALEGVYRIVLDNSEVWRITVTHQTVFTAKTVREIPAV